MKMTSFSINGRAVSRLSINGREVSLKQEPVVLCDALCFTAEEAGSTITVRKYGWGSDVNLQTSTNGISWTPYVVGDTITLANVDDKVYFKAIGSNSRMGSSNNNYHIFAMTGKIAASGNINSLLEEDEEAARTLSLAERSYCFVNMFGYNSALTRAPELPATTLAENCYRDMFRECTSLIQAPVIRATELASECCYSMFKDCSSLTQAPELPATTLASQCYYSMFNGCSSLTQAPKLQATTLAFECFERMFYGCSSLTQAPQLPATTLTYACYREMFYGCSSLTQAPVLPATTLAENCYSQMFIGCSSLTQAPELPATTLASNCYYQMFDNCTNINYVKVQFTNWDPADATYLWLPNNSGTFECPQALIDNTTTRGNSTVPESWTMVAV